VTAISLHCGNLVDILPTLPACSIDAVVTDPPYHLTEMTKRYGALDAQPCGAGQDGSFRRLSRGFMGKLWDGGGIAHQPETWAQVLRVLKPGGHLAAFGGTRTYHRLTCAIEDAGFEIRDTLAWMYGQGFPKSHNVGDGWGTALKPAHEPICLARKPLSEPTVAANVLKHGTGGINVDGCRIGDEITTHNTPGKDKFANMYSGSLVPKGGDTTHIGRWPANVVHDGSAEVVGLFPDSASRQRTGRRAGKDKGVLGAFVGQDSVVMGHDDSGSAARYFYCAKASAADRAGSKHPTVKPISLMRWLVRLITPPGGIVLDPFAGSGTTAEAVVREGCSAVLIEQESEYQADIRRRIQRLSEPLNAT
jgi:site-specific DNA-methyltransferase (adenine-specific)